MIYLLLGALVVTFVILRELAPTRYVVHAAHAKPLSTRPTNKWLLAGFVRDQNGRRIKTHGKFLGCADGDSMGLFGIPNRSSFIGDKLTDDDWRKLRQRDIVVVNGRAARSTTGYRLRMVDTVQDGTVSFLPDGKGFPHRSRPVSEIAARVRYVV